MKKFFIFVFTAAFIGLFASSASADMVNPNRANNNPNTVAYYPTGLHGIAGESQAHTGIDYVQQNGNSGNFDQWFCGSAATPDELTECEHSVWMSVGTATSCRAGGILVEDASASWGSYLSPGNYCVYNSETGSL